MRFLGNRREKEVKEKEPRVEPRPRRPDTSEEKTRRSANRANVPASRSPCLVHAPYRSSGGADVQMMCVRNACPSAVSFRRARALGQMLARDSPSHRMTA
jgi:hypothetical protein